MYPQYHQMTLDDYDFPFGNLDPENEWVKLAALVPWDVAEEEYAKQFVNNGHPAHPVRIASAPSVHPPWWSSGSVFRPRPSQLFWQRRCPEMMTINRILPRVVSVVPIQRPETAERSLWMQPAARRMWHFLRTFSCSMMPASIWSIWWTSSAHLPN